MPHNPQGRLLDDGLDVHAHTAAAGHTGAKDFVVQVDIEYSRFAAFHALQGLGASAGLGATAADPAGDYAPGLVDHGFGGDFRRRRTGGFDYGGDGEGVAALVHFVDDLMDIFAHCYGE